MTAAPATKGVTDRTTAAPRAAWAPCAPHPMTGRPHAAAFFEGWRATDATANPHPYGLAFDAWTLGALAAAMRRRVIIRHIHGAAWDFGDRIVGVYPDGRVRFL